jgi:DNA polymerase-3 subunit epsilon
VLILGLDFETTGFDPEQDRVIEVGAVLFDTEKSQPIKLMSELVKSSVAVSEEITGITGIAPQDLDRHGIPEDEAMGRLSDLINPASYIMAHFGTEFDQLFYRSWAKRSLWPQSRIPWLDSAIDIVYPANIKTRNLRHLAAEHGFLNPFSHRAVFDVLTMLRIASQYDIEAIIKRAAEPTLYMEALVSFERKDQAKDRGYKWFSPRKIWWKAFKESDLVVERAECGFMLRQLGGNPEKTA